MSLISAFCIPAGLFIVITILPVCGLRGEVKTQEPLVLDFQKPIQKVELALPKNLPPDTVLSLEVRGAFGFSEEPKVKGGKSAGVGKKIVIEIPDLPGAVIELSLQGKLGSMTIVAQPVFRERTGGEFDLTIPQLEKRVAGVTQAMAEAQATYAQFANVQQYAAKNLDTARAHGPLSRLDSNKDGFLDENERPDHNESAYEPKSLPEQNAFAQELTKYIEEIKQAGRRMATSTNRVKDLEKRVAAVPQIHKALLSWQESTQIGYAVVATSGVKKVVLVDAAISRTWTNGDFATDATFQMHADGKVQLRKSNGAFVAVDPGQLSEDDRKWLEHWTAK